MLIADANEDNKRPHSSLSEDIRLRLEPVLEISDAAALDIEHVERMYNVLKQIDPGSV